MRVTNEQARWVIGNVGDWWEWDGDDIEIDPLHDDLAMDLLEARAEAARLREALQPFAVPVDRSADDLESYRSYFNVGDIRAAARALEATR
jgi:hypothetical protein